VQARGCTAAELWHTASMVVARTLPDLKQLDEEALRALIISQHQEIIAQHERLLSHQDEIEHLKLLIAKLRRMQFGRKSEKLQQQIEQLELKLEELETVKRSAIYRPGQLRRLRRKLSHRNQPDRLFPNTCLAKSRPTNPSRMPVRIAVGICGNWARMCRRYSSTCRHGFE
jgi:predicted RecB family endonuclease